MQVLETGRLVLRWLTEDDAPFILGLLNEPSFLQYIGDKGVRTVDDARRYIVDGPMASYARHGFGLNLVVRKEDGAPLGMCGILKRDALPDPDIGYALLPAHWSKGYAYEAGAAVLQLGREQFGLRRIVAIVSPGNESSKTLLRRLGMQYETTIQLPGEDHGVDLFAIEMPAAVPAVP
jgi:RimJ/RimL family protein N-acetyltransferase